MVLLSYLGSPSVPTMGFPAFRLEAVEFLMVSKYTFGLFTRLRSNNRRPAIGTPISDRDPTNPVAAASAPHPNATY